jgi:methylmalonyl-CoA/ethylmalonyl-CoA epimerase
MRKKTVGELLSKFHHVGVVVRNVDQAVKYFQGLGIGPFESSNLVHINRRIDGKPAPGDAKVIARTTTMGPIGIELLQPISGKSTAQMWLESHGEGISHIAFIVDDIEEAKSTMVEAGFTIFTSMDNEGGGGTAFFSNEKVGGVVIEMEELPPHLDKDPYWGHKPWE